MALMTEQEQNEKLASPFHLHLDECEQCEAHPFDLCKVGIKLLMEEPLGIQFHDPLKGRNL